MLANQVAREAISVRSSSDAWPKQSSQDFIAFASIPSGPADPWHPAAIVSMMSLVMVGGRKVGVVEYASKDPPSDPMRVGSREAGCFSSRT